MTASTAAGNWLLCDSRTTCLSETRALPMQQHQVSPGYPLTAGAPRPSTAFAHPSPSFDGYMPPTHFFSGYPGASVSGYGSSASSSTGPLPSPDGYYGSLSGYPGVWSHGGVKSEVEKFEFEEVGLKTPPRRNANKTSKNSSTDSFSDVEDSKSGPTRRRARRYKTPSPQILRVRRQMANARERRRMNNLNVAYDELRDVLPDVDEGRRLSKMETLQMAYSYIHCLSELLKSEPQL